MNVSECMCRDVSIVNPDDSIQTAARKMAEEDVGFLPVGEGDRLIGIVTDRDIAVRGVAAGRTPGSSLRNVMSEKVNYCFEDDEADAVLHNMASVQLRRLPVVNRDKRLVGVVSIGDLSRAENATSAGEALGEISQPSGQHSQRI